jgi:AbrB family looped-hinge helix DNA binding protein
MSARGQVVIPKELRADLGWHRGQELAVEREADRIVLRRLDTTRREAFERFLRLEGMAAGDYSTERYLADKHADMEMEDRPKIGGDV